MASQAVAERKTNDPIRQAVDKLAPEFKAALPAHVSVDKFVRVTMTALNSDPNLRNADHRSLFGSITRLAQDGLLPDGREAALVIFNSKQNGEWIKKVQAMPMVAGLMKMMRQSGEVEWVDAHVVRNNDHFQYRPGIDEMPIFEPDWFGDRGEIIGVYAIAKLKSGEVVPPEIMSLDEIEKIRNVSKAKDRGPWVDWFDQMALKTVLRRYLKRLPTSTDVLTAFERDETMATTIEAIPIAAEMPVDNVTRLDALEHQIAEEIDEQEGDEAEEPETEESAEVSEAAPSDPEDDFPAWHGAVETIKVMIDQAKSEDALKAADDEFVKHSAALPDDVVADLEKAIAKKRRSLK